MKGQHSRISEPDIHRKALPVRIFSYTAVHPTPPLGLYLFSHNFSAISLVIPACLHIEFNVPCGMLLLFRGTITTLILPLYHPSKTSSFPCLLNETPSWFNTHATSLLDKFLSPNTIFRTYGAGILEVQRNRSKVLLLQFIFRKKECFQLIHLNRSINLFLSAL